MSTVTPKRKPDLIGWIGAVLVSIAPFFIDSNGGKLALIAGLLLFTVKAYQAGLRSMVAANVVAIIGYTFSLIG